MQLAVGRARRAVELALHTNSVRGTLNALSQRDRASDFHTLAPVVRVCRFRCHVEVFTSPGRQGPRVIAAPARDRPRHCAGSKPGGDWLTGTSPAEQDSDMGFGMKQRLRPGTVNLPLNAAAALGAPSGRSADPVNSKSMSGPIRSTMLVTGLPQSGSVTRWRRSVPSGSPRTSEEKKLL